MKWWPALWTFARVEDVEPTNNVSERALRAGGAVAQGQLLVGQRSRQSVRGAAIHGDRLGPPARAAVAGFAGGCGGSCAPANRGPLAPRRTAGRANAYAAGKKVKAGAMTQDAAVPLELDDIQSAVLRPRPTPYAVAYLLLRIDDRKAGRELLRRASAVVPSAADHEEAGARTPGLTSPSRSRGSARWVCHRIPLIASQKEFSVGWRHARQTWATRGESGPRAVGKRRWAPRTCTSCCTLYNQTPERLAAAMARTRGAPDCPGDHARSGARTATALPTETEHFGFRDGISQPAIEGSGMPGTNPTRRPSRRANSSWATPTRWADASDTRSLRFSGATAPTSPSASCTSAWPRSANT